MASLDKEIRVLALKGNKGNSAYQDAVENELFSGTLEEFISAFATPENYITRYEFQKVTQAQYDALKDAGQLIANCYYVITDDDSWETMQQLISDVDNLKGDVQTLQTDLGTAEDDIDALETRMQTAEDDIDNVETLVGVVQGEIGDVELDVANLKIDVTALKNKINKVAVSPDHIEDAGLYVIYASYTDGYQDFGISDLIYIPYLATYEVKSKYCKYTYANGIQLLPEYATTYTITLCNLYKI